MVTDRVYLPIVRIRLFKSRYPFIRFGIESANGVIRRYWLPPSVLICCFIMLFVVFSYLVLILMKSNAAMSDKWPLLLVGGNVFGQPMPFCII